MDPKTLVVFLEVLNNLSPIFGSILQYHKCKHGAIYSDPVNEIFIFRCISKFYFF
jgi:hypothetical protein